MMEEPLHVNAPGELHLAAKKEILCAFSGNLVKCNSWAASLCYVLVYSYPVALNNIFCTCRNAYMYYKSAGAGCDKYDLCQAKRDLVASGL